MSLEEYRADMLRCTRCSYCKWVPLDQVKSLRFAKGCPSVEYNRFQTYSAGGRLSATLSILEGRSDYTDRFIDVAYNCLLCGSCDVSCKVCRFNMEPLQAMRELRFKLVEDGRVLPSHTAAIAGLKKENNMLGKPRADRSKWAEGLDVKDISNGRAGVIFHAGCRYSYDPDLQKVARTAVTILKNAGVDVGIIKSEESCCGARAYDMGYRQEFSRWAGKNLKAWERSGATTVVTSCADCYYAFKRLYPEVGSRFEVLHTVEFIDRLIKSGKLKFSRSVPLKVTYHDPCHLGRQGEPYVPWQGQEKKIRGQLVTYEPRRPRYNGAQGVYQPPRDVLTAIPGLTLVEMERNREYAWCCGAAGGVKEAFPGFSAWTASERVEEARSTGAQALVSACPWCERNFIDAVGPARNEMKVLDILELVQQAI